MRRLSGLTRRTYLNFWAASGRMSRHPCPILLNSSLNLLMSAPHFKFSRRARSRVFIAPYSFYSEVRISSYCNSDQLGRFCSHVNARPLRSCTNCGALSQSGIPETRTRYSILERKEAKSPVPSNLGHALSETFNERYSTIEGGWLT